MSWLRFLPALGVLLSGLAFGLAGPLWAQDAPDAPEAEAPVAHDTAADGAADQAAAGEEERELTPDEIKALKEERFGVHYVEGPIKFDLGPMAQLDLPAGYRALNADDTRKLMRGYGNLPTDTEAGAVEPADGSWVIVFEFSDIGYVKDDDKDELDADAILKQKKESQEAMNPKLKEMGLSQLEVVDWVMPPNYNEQTHNLQWSIRIRDKESGNESVNHLTRLLGRRGVMEVTLLCSPEQLQSVLPEFDTLLTKYNFKQGEDYASFKPGDRVAELGLAALVTGGAAAVAYKTGLLAKLGVLFAKAGKGIIVAIIAVLAVIGRLLGIGKKSSS